MQSRPTGAEEMLLSLNISLLKMPEFLDLIKQLQHMFTMEMHLPWCDHRPIASYEISSPQHDRVSSFGDVDTRSLFKCDITSLTFP